MPDYNPHIGDKPRMAFLLTQDPEQVATSITPERAVVGVDRVGDNQPGAGLFYPIAGRAVARTRNPRRDYGGADGITSDAILAEYDPTTKRVYALDTLGSRNPRTAPWEVGKDIALLADARKPSKGVVVRGCLTGEKGFDAHVYIAAAAGPRAGQAPIILHHEQPNPPDNSTLAYDPDGASNRVAPLSDALRIRAGLATLCQPITGVKEPELYWVYLNGTRSGGRESGWLATTFDREDALLSNEVGGPLRPSSVKHELGITSDKRSVRVGALSCDALFTRGNPEFDAPLWIEDVEEPNVQEPSGHPVRVHIQHDKDGTNGPHTHGFICKPGQRIGMRKVWVAAPVVEGPPCKGQRKKPITGPARDMLPSTSLGYFAGIHQSNGLGFLSHPGA